MVNTFQLILLLNDVKVTIKTPYQINVKKRKKNSSVIQIDNQIQSFKNKLCYYPIKYALDVNKLDFISSLFFL